MEIIVTLFRGKNKGGSCTYSVQMYCSRVLFDPSLSEFMNVGCRVWQLWRVDWSWLWYHRSHHNLPLSLCREEIKALSFCFSCHIVEEPTEVMYPGCVIIFTFLSLPLLVRSPRISSTHTHTNCCSPIPVWSHKRTILLLCFVFLFYKLVTAKSYSTA